MNKKIQKVLSAFFAVALCFSLYAPGLSVSAKTTAQLQSDINDYDKKIKQAQEKLKSIASDKANQKEYISALNEKIDAMGEQMNLIQQKIDVINADIDSTNVKITAKTNEIAEKEKSIKEVQTNITSKETEIDDTLDLLCERLRAAYMAGSASTLEILLSCEDIASFLTTSEMLKRVAEYDDALIKKLNKKIKELTKMKTKLEKEKAELVDDKKELDSEKAVLDTKLNEQQSEKNVYETKKASMQSGITEAQNKINSLEKDEAYYKQVEQQFEANQRAAEAQIQAIIAAAQKTTAPTTQKPTSSGGSSSGGSSSGGSSSGGSSSGGTSSGGSSSGGSSSGGGTSYTPSSSGFICPLQYPGTYISSGWGYRDSFMTGSGQYSTSNHGGTDITCPGASSYDKRLVASKAGTVIQAGWFGGYGNTVMIDHGGGYVTLYGHMNSVSVYNGQYVSQGQTIGIMGSTGNSTGPHVHFEVRVNGVKQCPTNYIHVP